jgi:hypothetical protein
VLLDLGETFNVNEETMNNVWKQFLKQLWGEGQGNEYNQVPFG